MSSDSHKLFGDLNVPPLTREDIEKNGFKPERMLMTQEAADQLFEDDATFKEWPKRVACMDGVTRIYNSRAEWSNDSRRRSNEIFQGTF